MRWIRYEADGRTSYGILEGNEVEQVSGTFSATIGARAVAGGKRAIT